MTSPVSLDPLANYRSTRCIAHQRAQRPQHAGHQTQAPHTSTAPTCALVVDVVDEASRRRVDRGVDRSVAEGVAVDGLDGLHGGTEW